LGLEEKGVLSKVWGEEGEGKKKKKDAGSEEHVKAEKKDHFPYTWHVELGKKKLTIYGGGGNV